MRRVTLMLAAMGVMVTLFAGVAYAATIEGTSGSFAMGIAI
jgi:transposase